MQGSPEAADVFARRIMQLMEAFPSQQEAVLDSVLGDPAGGQQTAHAVPAAQLIAQLQEGLGWNVLLCNSGQAL